ncbi:hypothetical protein I5168_08010 [Nonlabens sp. SCSIO 43208]|uniref:hypothetical protein n=1 Tax=Nonlabens sp. SCSIO 43208 TaxID=2793009 RepID=UPI003D6A79AA
MRILKVIFLYILFILLSCCNAIDIDSKENIYEIIITHFENDPSVSKELEDNYVFEISKISKRNKQSYIFMTSDNKEVVLPDSLFNYNYISRNNRLFYWHDSTLNKNRHSFYDLLLKKGKKLDSCMWYSKITKEECNDYEIIVNPPTFIGAYDILSRGQKLIAKKKIFR